MNERIAMPDEPGQNTNNQEGAFRLVLVTGPSGAGRSTAIHALEDLDFEVIDNLPLSLAPRLIEGPAPPHPVALGLDVRNRDFSAFNLIELIDQLTRNPNVALEVLYVDCSPKVLARRYGETRRPHPLAPSDSPELGIALETDLLTPIRARANHFIDTSELTVHNLKAEVLQRFAPQKFENMAVSLHSFSYKRGVPHGLDMIFDCRFLRNPHWQPELRAKNGLDVAVQDYIKADPRFAEFHQKVSDLLIFLLPAQKDEGKAYLSIGFGCTGGQHRSVAMVEFVTESLAQSGWEVSKRHREQERRSAAGFGAAVQDKGASSA